MGQYLVIFLLWLSTGFALEYKTQIQFLAASGRINQAIDLYKEIKEKSGKHDTELLRELGMGILLRGKNSNDPEILLLTLFGAGISMDESVEHIVAEGIESEIPELNLIALNFITAFSHDDAEALLLKALRSNHLLIRLEAIHRLSLVRHPFAFTQAEALLYKLEGEILAVFPQFFLMIDDPKASRLIKKLLVHSKSEVRVATTLGIIKQGRDDFLPLIKGGVLHHDIALQEVSALALGAFKDTDSTQKLMQMTNSPFENVKISSLRALHLLGNEEARGNLAKMAVAGNLFAIALLGEIPGSEETMVSLLENKNPEIRFNAAMALLELKDGRAIKGISDILIHDARDIAISKHSTIGKTLSYYKLVPSAGHNDTPLLNELSLKMKEEILEKAVHLKEKEFLLLAEKLLMARQDALVPALTHLLEGMETEGAIQLLRKSADQLGAPLIRSYANLSLYRLGLDGPYFENLRDWMQNQKNVAMIQLRPLVPFTMQGVSFELAPEESSRILIEAFESFVKTQDERGLDVLIDMIRNGNPKNRFALAGILLRGCL